MSPSSHRHYECRCRRSGSNSSGRSYYLIPFTMIVMMAVMTLIIMGMMMDHDNSFVVGIISNHVRSEAEEKGDETHDIYRHLSSPLLLPPPQKNLPSLPSSTKQRRRYTSTIPKTPPRTTNETTSSSSLQPPPPPLPLLHRSLSTTSSSPQPPGWPSIAWLMTYPNSGTGFTLMLVQIASGFATGTNYGLELRNSHIDYLDNPYFSMSPNGPFRGSRRPFPPSFMLTKTHCLGYCDECAPKNFVMSRGETEKFLEGCALGTKHLVMENGMHEDVRVSYNPRIVKKVVHLIRSPFDNVVSRFHYSYVVHKKRGTFGKAAGKFDYPWSPSGFRSYCKYWDEKFTVEEELEVMEESVVRLGRNVPCRSMFYQYVQWHNNALAVEKERQMETLVLFYEDYALDLKASLEQLMNFLDLEQAGVVRRFEWNGGYIHFFTVEERDHIKDYVKAVASEETWDLVKRYFDAMDALGGELIGGGGGGGGDETEQGGEGAEREDGIEGGERPSMAGTAAAALAAKDAREEPIPHPIITPPTTTSTPRWPKVAWLMSYPNSGTGFTLLITQVASNKSTGTNYGYELGYNGINYLDNPEYSQSENGPYKMSRRPLPDNIILTKTHCIGGHCDKCPPVDYIINPEQFFDGCRTGQRHDHPAPFIDSDDPEEIAAVYRTKKIVTASYDPSPILTKLVHLVRHPLDNIVARFHYACKLAEEKRILNTQSFPYTWDKRGFNSYCDEINSLHGDQTRMALGGDDGGEDIIEKFRLVPCRAVFYKYVQWHNNAFAITHQERQRQLERLVIYYEDYEGLTFRPTVSKLLDFLELPDTGRVKEFRFNGGYVNDFYDEEERVAVEEFIRRFASEETMQHLERYFS